MAPRPSKPVTSDVLEARDRLFAEGSTFLPVAREAILGIDGLVSEAERIIRYLANFQAYAEHGATIEAGTVFHGHPGVGKTLTATWVASESNARFVSLRDWPLASGATSLRGADIHDIYRRAREVAAAGIPVLLFWDEATQLVDREAHWEAENSKEVTSQLISELHGHSGQPLGVYLIATTNSIKGIDAALLRAGRLRTLEFPALSGAVSVDLMNLEIAGYRGAAELDLERVGWYVRTVTSAAEISQAVKCAWTMSVTRALDDRSQPRLTTETLIEGLLETVHGCRTGIPNDARVAEHEVSHFVVALAVGAPAMYLETVGRGKSNGRICLESSWRKNVADGLADLAITLAPLTFERLVGQPESFGNWGDLRQATRCAQRLVHSFTVGTRYATIQPSELSNLGAHASRVSDELIAATEADVERLHEVALGIAAGVIESIGTDTIQRIAGEILERERLTRPELLDLLARHDAVIEPVELPAVIDLALLAA